MLTTGNARAYGVLSALFANHDMTGFIIEPMINGRENGFKVSSWSKAAAFCRDRRCDNIIVYTGESYKFSMQGNGPGDHEMYKNGEWFDENDFAGAAKFVFDYVTKKKEEDNE